MQNVCRGWMEVDRLTDRKMSEHKESEIERKGSDSGRTYSSVTPSQVKSFAVFEL